MYDFKKQLKNLTTLKVILTFRIMSGYYQRGFPNKKFATFATLWSILFSVFLTFSGVVIFTAGSTRIPKGIIFIYGLFIIDYILHVFGSALTGERYLFKYLNVIRTIDTSMKWKKPRDGVIVTAIFIGHVVFIIYFYIMIGLPNPGIFKDLSSYFFNATYVCVSLGYFPKIIIFESLWRRMQLLREWVDQQPDADRTWVWKTSLHTYKNLLDNVAHTNKIVKLTMVLEFPIVSARIMWISYNFLSDLMNENTWYKVVHTPMVMIQLLCMFGCGLAPAMLLEMTAYEYEKLLGRLAEDILFNSDTSSRDMLQETLRYLEERPPRYTLWRVFPLDATLLYGMVGLCVTYTVVLLQFQEKS